MPSDQQLQWSQSSLPIVAPLFPAFTTKAVDHSPPSLSPWHCLSTRLTGIVIGGTSAVFAQRVAREELERKKKAVTQIRVSVPTLTDTRVKLHAESLGVARPAGAHLLVSGVLLVPVCVANLRLQDARDTLVRQLDSPKATCSRERRRGERRGEWADRVRAGIKQRHGRTKDESTSSSFVQRRAPLTLCASGISEIKSGRMFQYGLSHVHYLPRDLLCRLPQRAGILYVCV